MVSNSSSSNPVLLNGGWNGESFKDWSSGDNTISSINNATGSSTVGEQGKDRWVGNMVTGNLELFEEDFGHLLLVGFWVEWDLCEEYVVIL